MTHAEIQQGHILIVEDDEKYRLAVKDYLDVFGYKVSEAGNGEEMDRTFSQQAVDLVLMDLMLPGENGLSLARRLRDKHSRLPIIMLSSCGEETDRIVGLEIGANMYLSKPISLRELLAHIRAALRQSQAQGNAEENKDEAPSLPKNYYFGSFELNTLSRRLSRNMEEISLTAAEYELLIIFITHPNKVLSRDHLGMMINGYEPAPFDRSIDVRVSRLRAKIEHDPSKPVYINTLRGEGYMFSPH